MKEIIGNLLDVTDGILVHQVNCQRVAGAGLAACIRNKYPDWYAHFIGLKAYLGFVDFFRVSPDLIIVSFYAQDRYGRERQHTNYAAFEKCLAFLHGELLTNPVFAGKTVYFPYGIGCGLAGGDWKVIEPLIERYVPESVVVKLNK